VRCCPKATTALVSATPTQPPVSLAVLKMPDATPAFDGGTATNAMPFNGIVKAAPVPPSNMPGTNDRELLDSSVPDSNRKAQASNTSPATTTTRAGTYRTSAPVSGATSRIINNHGRSAIAACAGEAPLACCRNSAVNRNAPNQATPMANVTAFAAAKRPRSRDGSISGIGARRSTRTNPTAAAAATSSGPATAEVQP
jgi:hypothetical protein